LNEEIDIHDIEKEIKILKQCKSPFIVSYYGLFRLDTILWILMDYCGLGSVADIIDINSKPFDEKESAWVIGSALNGLSYLHSLGIVHRDVKGGNILVNEEGNIKIADFGVSEKLGKVIMAEVAGTPLWMAPEVAKRGESYNHKADIWSLGITLIELIDGQPPLAELNAYGVMLAIQRNEPPTVQYPKNMSANFLDFLSKCLVKEVIERWDTKSLLSHPFVIHAKQSDIKSIIEKTIKNKKTHKFRQAAYIDHTPGKMEQRIIKKDSQHQEEERYTIPLPEDSASDIVSYVELEDPKKNNNTNILDSVLQHSSPSLGVIIVGAGVGGAGAGAGAGGVGVGGGVGRGPAWAQPGYVPNVENPPESGSFSSIVEVMHTPERPSVPEPGHVGGRAEPGGSPLIKKGTHSPKKESYIAKKELPRPIEVISDLDYTTPRVSVTEKAPLVQRQKAREEPCTCPCTCTIL